MSKQQKGKGKKRKKSWHRGEVAESRFKRAIHQLPKPDPSVDYTQAAPQPIRRVGGQNRGDAAK